IQRREITPFSEIVIMKMQQAVMNMIVRILVGGFTGWLTGIAAGEEGYGKTMRERQVRILDTVYGIIGAFIGEYLFFWIVIGKGDAFSDYVTMVLGSITLVGAARLIAARWRSSRSHQRIPRAAHFELYRTNES
ncbi:MAG TPA: GlsB/YeaQ/YmgE family stress response membrane protein, partial [Candidatus Binatia bacterium]|nr:GlsB/YeaQ/YmgE family stress response membrane protein [Candidatus Binatia bacterium]